MRKEVATPGPHTPVSPSHLAGLIRRVDDGTLSPTLAKEVLARMAEQDLDADRIIEREGLRTVGGEEELLAVVDRVIEDHPQVVEQYRGGKTNALQFLMGQCMRETKGRAKPRKLIELLRRRLD